MKKIMKLCQSFCWSIVVNDVNKVDLYHALSNILEFATNPALYLKYDKIWQKGIFA